MMVTRKGVRRDSVVLVAPANLRAELGGASGRMILECHAAQVYNAGDGLELEIALRSSGNERMLMRRSFDAARRAEDRAWTTLRLPLELSGNSGETLEVRVGPGAQGDLTADWIALADLCVRRLESRP